MKFCLKKVVAAIICLAMLLGSFSSVSAFSQAEGLGVSNYYLLQDIIDLYIETSLYETDRETLIDSMLYNYLVNNPLMLAALANALLSTNDPYSAYYTAQNPFSRATSTSYGFTLADSSSFEDGDERKERAGIYVTEIIEGSNAQFAGLMAGDRFVSIDGVNVEGLTTAGIKYILNNMPYTRKNETESPVYQEFAAPDYNAERFMDFMRLSWDFTKEVKMTVERIDENGNNELVDIFVCKGIATTKDVFHSIDKQTSTALIEISAFNSDATFDQFKNAVDEVYVSGCKNIILDLRDNPGGEETSMLRMVSLFLEEGTPLYYTRSRVPDETVAKLAEGGEKYDPSQFEKILILVNENTASAAELLAYICKTQLGAVLIGKTTYGKAVGQRLYNVSTGDSFTITSLEILTLEKESYNGIGIVPDLYVPDATEKYEFPTGLSHFNHENYVTILPGAQNDAVLALEQRFGILGIMRPEKIDGIYDEATSACTMIYRNVTMGEKIPSSEVTFDMVTKMTSSINMYKNLNVHIDSQMDVAQLYIKNKSQGKRLASEYAKAEERRQKELEAERKAAQKEYEEEMRKEREALKNEQEDESEQTQESQTPQND